jgi:large subunit ribosomal protein L23
MKIKPIFTEKSLNLAKDGKYSFLVGKNDTKTGLKSKFAKLFNVHVTDIRTITTPGELKRSNRGKKVTVLRGKKAIITLKAGEKIDLFEVSKK